MPVTHPPTLADMVVWVGCAQWGCALGRTRRTEEVLSAEVVAVGVRADLDADHLAALRLGRHPDVDDDHPDSIVT